MGPQQEQITAGTSKGQKKVYFYKTTLGRQEEDKEEKEKSDKWWISHGTLHSCVFFSLFSNGSSFRHEKYMLLLQTHQNFSFVLRKISSILQSVRVLQTGAIDILKQSLTLLLSKDLITVIRN